MAEQLNLTTPESPRVPGATTYRNARLVIDMGVPPYMGEAVTLDPQYAHVTVTVLGDNGALRTFVLAEGAQAITMIQGLNTADLRTNTLNRRLLNLVAQAASELTGTIVDV